MFLHEDEYYIKLLYYINLYYEQLGKAYKYQSLNLWFFNVNEDPGELTRQSGGIAITQICISVSKTLWLNIIVVFSFLFLVWFYINWYQYLYHGNNWNLKLFCFLETNKIELHVRFCNDRGKHCWTSYFEKYSGESDLLTKYPYCLVSLILTYLIKNYY